MRPYHTERLGDSQVIGLLRLALPTRPAANALASTLQLLVEKPSSALLHEAREQMAEHGLGTAETASLLGVSELTVRRWFEIAEDLPPAARHKLAGMCILLSHAREITQDSEIAKQVRLALSIAKSGDPKFSAAAGDAPSQVVASVFDAAGVAAIALYRLLAAEAKCSGQQDERRVDEAEEVAEEP